MPILSRRTGVDLSCIMHHVRVLEHEVAAELRASKTYLYVAGDEVRITAPVVFACEQGFDHAGDDHDVMFDDDRRLLLTPHRRQHLMVAGVGLRPDHLVLRFLIDTHCGPAHRLRAVLLKCCHRVWLQVSTCEGYDDTAHTLMLQGAGPRSIA